MSRRSAADRPAEAINDSDDGIQEIKQPPFVRNNVTAEAYRRNEEAELHNKWDDVAEIPEFSLRAVRNKLGPKAAYAPALGRGLSIRDKVYQISPVTVKRFTSASLTNRATPRGSPLFPLRPAFRFFVANIKRVFITILP
jgi:hypothetical protein